MCHGNFQNLNRRALTLQRLAHWSVVIITEQICVNSLDDARLIVDESAAEIMNTPARILRPHQHILWRKFQLCKFCRRNIFVECKTTIRGSREDVLWLRVYRRSYWTAGFRHVNFVTMIYRKYFYTLLMYIVCKSWWQSLLCCKSLSFIWHYFFLCQI